MPSSPRAIPTPAASTTSSSRGLGRGVAFVFAWARMTVIQTGAIAAVAFVFGDYASEMLRLGEKSSAIYAAIGGRRAHACSTSPARAIEDACRSVMQIALIAGPRCCSPWRRCHGRRAGEAGARRRRRRQPFGLAMIFVLLTYGGWNEAAYLAGEVRDAAPQHDRASWSAACSPSPRSTCW